MQIILGSFAEGVIHHAHYPVITIGPNVSVSPSEDIPFRTIVFATDLNHHSAQKAAVALMFAKDSLARIYMCHVLGHAPVTSPTRSICSSAPRRSFRS